MARKQRPFWPYGLLIFTALLLADQYSKHLVRTAFVIGESHQVFPGLWLTHITNTGTLWGLLADTNAAFVWLSVIAFGLLLYFHDEFQTTVEKIAYAMLLAGLWGNLIDRGVYGGVTDFIDLGWWPVFNIADAALTTAITLFLLEQIRKKRLTQSKHKA